MRLYQGDAQSGSFKILVLKSLHVLELLSHLIFFFFFSCWLMYFYLFLFTYAVISTFLSPSVWKCKKVSEQFCLTFVQVQMPAVVVDSTRLCMNSAPLFFQVPWPVDVVVSSKCQNLYNQVFRFLLQIKRAKYGLDRLRFSGAWASYVCGREVVWQVVRAQTLDQGVPGLNPGSSSNIVSTVWSVQELPLWDFCPLPLVSRVPLLSFLTSPFIQPHFSRILFQCEVLCLQMSTCPLWHTGLCLHLVWPSRGL